MVTSTKDHVARVLAEAHYRVEPDLTDIIRLRRAADVELRPEEPIKLLEVNPATIPAGIMPLRFGPEPTHGVPYPSVIVEVTPEEFEEIKKGRLVLPDGWQLAESLSRNGNGASGASS